MKLVISVDIRELKVDDQERVLQIIHDASRISNSEDYPQDFIEYLLENRYNHSWFQENVSKKNRYVVIDSKSIIAVGGLKEQEIVHMFVDPKVQGKGVGSYLLKFLLEIAKSFNYSNVHLNSTITATEFYRKHGFEIEFQRTVKVLSYDIISYRMNFTF